MKQQRQPSKCPGIPLLTWVIISMPEKCGIKLLINSTVEVWQRTSNFISLFIMNVITCPRYKDKRHFQFFPRDLLIWIWKTQKGMGVGSAGWIHKHDPRTVAQKEKMIPSRSMFHILSHTPLYISTISGACVCKVCETHRLKVKWQKRTG